MHIHVKSLEVKVGIDEQCKWVVCMYAGVLLLQCAGLQYLCELLLSVECWHLVFAVDQSSVPTGRAAPRLIRSL